MNLNDLQSQVALGEDSRRLFIFDNRIEIISPGHLPNNLTVAKIRAGNSIIRNPILVSYIAKGLLPYRGLGSGIKRALDDWPEIEFVDDREANLFTAMVHRAWFIDWFMKLYNFRGVEHAHVRVLRPQAAPGGAHSAMNCKA
jgi:hypothetical protein